jgi:hypothetical protein
MDINHWRIKLRDDDGGDDLWPQCEKESVIAITYEGVKDVDLQAYSRSFPPPRWNDLQPGQKGSISHFAWDIRGGDVVYVGDSKQKAIVAVGHIRGRRGENPYRFTSASPVAPRGKDPWLHLIGVDWNRDFRPFPYRDKTGQTTLVQLNRDRVQEFEQTQRRQLLLSGDQVAPEDEISHLLQEDSYFRYTSAVTREICRQHAALSNRFASWLMATRRIRLAQEKERTDAVFQIAETRFLVEFKIAYNNETRYAIRQALGQILEYNFYPLRSPRDRWLLVLDCPPSPEDVAFIKRLYDQLHLPVFLVDLRRKAGRRQVGRKRGAFVGAMSSAMFKLRYSPVRRHFDGGGGARTPYN